MTARVPRRSLIALAAVAAAALLLAVTVAGSSGDTIAGSSASAKVVGEVTSLSGTESLRRKADGGKKTTALKAGDELHLGDTIVSGRGVIATLTLTIPKGVSADTELVYVKAKRATENTVTLERTGKRTTVVTIEG